VFAVIAGTLTAIVAYFFGGAVALVAMHGMPLGSPGGPPTSGDVLVHLVLAALASLVGAMLAIRIARAFPYPHALVVGLVLAIGAITAFAKNSSSWPVWFGSGIAAASILGAILAARWIKRGSGT
jgi:hypothetical protein